MRDSIVASAKIDSIKRLIKFLFSLLLENYYHTLYTCYAGFGFMVAAEVREWLRPPRNLHTSTLRRLRLHHRRHLLIYSGSGKQMLATLQGMRFLPISIFFALEETRWACLFCDALRPLCEEFYRVLGSTFTDVCRN